MSPFSVPHHIRHSPCAHSSHYPIPRPQSSFIIQFRTTLKSNTKNTKWLTNQSPKFVPTKISFKSIMETTRATIPPINNNTEFSCHHNRFDKSSLIYVSQSTYGTKCPRIIVARSSSREFDRIPFNTRPTTTKTTRKVAAKTAALSSISFNRLTRSSHLCSV